MIGTKRAHLRRPPQRLPAPGSAGAWACSKRRAWHAPVSEASFVTSGDRPDVGL
jgi:hypothetical protein